jgi:putative glutamine amidotransferase
MVRNRPLIGVSAYEVPAAFSHWHDVSCVMVPSGYTRSIDAAGGLPVVLPPLDDMAQVLDRLDGLVLTGGSDVDPQVYGEEPHSETIGVHPGRDRAELRLLGAAVERGMPVLGICRGMQLLNVLRGGTLQQHLADVVADGGVHKGPPGTFTRHPVRMQDGTLAAALLGPKAEVHSCHHQAPDRLGDGLQVSAEAPDGVVEAIELPGRFCLGVLWHPEEDARGGGPLFAGLVDAARRGSAAGVRIPA